MKDILIISNYFPPEIGAAPNRIFQMAKSLSKTHNVTVICPFSNYPTGKVFKNFKKSEIIDGISVERLWVYPSNSRNKSVRLFSMLSFSLSIVWFFLIHKIPKTVIVNSPPLLVAFTSLFFLSSKKQKLVLNVSDLWPQAGLDLGAIKQGFGYKMLQKIERYNYKKAHLILGQSEEILTHIKTIIPNTETLLYRNFPNFEAAKPKVFQSKKTAEIKVVYAGLLGVAQGVLKLCKQLDYANIQFHIYGSGAEETELINFIKSNPNLPITFHGSLTRQKLHKALVNYDVTIIPLLNRIYGSVPSKIFEYSRLGIPILYFGGGEGEKLVEKYNLGWVAKAGDYEALNNVIFKINTSDFDIAFKEGIQKTSLKYFDASSQLKALQNKL